MSEFIEILSRFGVPVAFCVALAWYVKYINDKHDKERKEISDKHAAEIKELRETHERTAAELRQALDNNTRVMTELTYYLKGGVNVER